MLAPPPDKDSFNKVALKDEGKERYLKSLENKLNRLQGTNKRGITSKDIVHSLSEARDDHMRQFVDPDPADSSTTTSITSCTDSSELPKNDPWHAIPTRTNQTAARESLLEFEDLEADHKRRDSLCARACFVCLAQVVCCKSNRENYYQRSSAGSNLTMEEEKEYLTDCDELGLTWEDRTSTRSRATNESVV